MIMSSIMMDAVMPGPAIPERTMAHVTCEGLVQIQKPGFVALLVPACL